jgi:hypothetical protein
VLTTVHHQKCRGSAGRNVATTERGHHKSLRPVKNV